METRSNSFFAGIGGKILMIFLGVLVLSIAALSIISALRSSAALYEQSFDKLEAVKSIKKNQIVTFFDEVKDDIQVYAYNTAVIQAAQRFITAFYEHGIKSPEWNEWKSIHGPKLEKFKTVYGYYDFFIISLEGDIVYTVEEELDFGKNLVSGGLASSSLAKAFQGGKTKITLSDFEMYEPSGEPAAFAAVPIGDDTTGIVGVLAVQISLTGINSIMQERHGMGISGETYLVGMDKLMRSDSFIDKKGRSVVRSFQGTVEDNGVDTQASRKGIAGEPGKDVILDYTNNYVLSAWEKVDFGDFSWIIIAEINQSEIDAPVWELIFSILLAALVILIIGAVVAVLFSRSISRPILSIVDGATRLSLGDITLDSGERDVLDKITRRNDELGLIGGAFNELISYFQEKVSIAREIADKNLTVSPSAASENDELGKAFQQMVSSLNTILGHVNMAVENVDSAASQVATASQSLSQGATEQASSLEQIAASINEVNSQADQNAVNSSEASILAGKTAKNAKEGFKQMESLVQSMEVINSSSEKIKKVVKFIDDIAFQINLLALNANVEAARAGKYGKGFAVVAEEVRNLANKSTASVSDTNAMVEDSIRSINTGTELVDKTSSQFKEILEAAGKVSDVLEEISMASKEQAVGMNQISSGLDQVEQVTQDNTASAEESASASEELSAQAKELKHMVAAFRLKR